MRKLPAPWSAEKTDGGYRVRDNSGRTLCYIYCRDDEKNADVANVLTWEEGRRIAAKIAMLPELLKGGASVLGEQHGALILGEANKFARE